MRHLVRARDLADSRYPEALTVDDMTTTKGFAGTLFLTTDDAWKACEELTARGVEFTEKPNVQPYGIGCGFRDPSGNSVRLAQRTPMG